MNDNIMNQLRELENDDALPDYATQSFHEAAAEIERLREALKQEQEKFQLETLRTSECSVLLRRWNAQARFHNHDNAWSGAESCEWCTLVGDSEKLLAAPVNLGRVAQELKP